MRSVPWPAWQEALGLIARWEFRSALRGRLIPAFGALFALLCVGIALAGLGGSGRLLVQGFTRTAASLLNLAVYVFPLIGLILGASAFSDAEGEVELLVAQPVSRSVVLAGRLAGLFGALSLIAVSGFGAAALLVILRSGTAGIGGYLWVTAASLAGGAVGLCVGALLGVLLRNGATAVGWALVVWLTFAVLFDLALIGAVQILGGGAPGPGMAAVLAANPIEALRTLALVRLDAELLLGGAGATLVDAFGRGPGQAVLVAGVALWAVVPAGLAAARFARQDL